MSKEHRPGDFEAIVSQCFVFGSLHWQVVAHLSEQPLRAMAVMVSVLCLVVALMLLAQAISMQTDSTPSALTD